MATEKMSVIERAEQRLAEEERQHELGADNRYDLHYWAAYLDGARAQMRETKKHMEQDELVDLFRKYLVDEHEIVWAKIRGALDKRREDIATYYKACLDGKVVQDGIHAD